MSGAVMPGPKTREANSYKTTFKAISSPLSAKNFQKLTRFLHELDTDIFEVQPSLEVYTDDN